MSPYLFPPGLDTQTAQQDLQAINNRINAYNQKLALIPLIITPLKQSDLISNLYLACLHASAAYVWLLGQLIRAKKGEKQDGSQ
jgi:hypothetical protein